MRIGCPTGFDDVEGDVALWPMIEAGVEQRELSRVARFRCDQQEVTVSIRILPAQLSRLRREPGPVVVRVKVTARAKGFRPAVDYDDVVLELER